MGFIKHFSQGNELEDGYDESMAFPSFKEDDNDIGQGSSPVHNIVSLSKQPIQEADCERRTAELYNELLMAVKTKYEKETRHQTALRYIQERENKDINCCGSQG